MSQHHFYKNNFYFKWHPFDPLLNVSYIPLFYFPLLRFILALTQNSHHLHHHHDQSLHQILHKHHHRQQTGPYLLPHHW